MSELVISGVIVDLILFFIITGNATLGYRRGLVRVVFSVCSSLIAIVLVLILYRPTTNYIIKHTTASEKLETIFEENLQSFIEKDKIEDTQALLKNNAFLNLFIGDEIEEGLIAEKTDNIIQYASVQISHKIISVIVFFILFIVVRLLLYMVRGYIELIANLPIIRIINKSGGMVYGVIKGFVIIYVTFAILTLIMPAINNNTIILSAIQNARIGSQMFHNNMILNLIFKFL